MNEDLIPPAFGTASSPASSLDPAAARAFATGAGPMPPASTARWLWPALAVIGALCIASLLLAWKTEQRGAGLEQELVRRQQDMAGKVTEARALAKQAQESAGATAAKVALLEARVAEVAVQRTQLEDLIQSLSRSRDESVLVDIEAGIRVALQQAAITGSAEPLVVTLQQSDERLSRHGQPRLEGVRRAIGRDLDRVKASSVTDIASLAIKLDEAVRLIDELPLLGVADARRAADAVGSPSMVKVDGASGASAPATTAGSAPGWGRQAVATWNAFGEKVWGEARSLVRVSRIDHPEAMLLAPEQSFFVRENLKLRLLNARLALLSRQLDTAQTDLQASQTTLDRYFDRTSKRTVLASELMRQVAGQARQVTVPRPDDTLAALTAASAGR